MKLTKNDFITQLNSLIPDNGTQQISPLDLRIVIRDTADSTVNFLNGQNLNTANFSTPEVTSTRAGIDALSKYNLPGYVTSGNSAFGYQSLHSNYHGLDNTAVGAFSLGCNLYGNYNVGVGYTALGGNVAGSGNIGIGSHTLQSNKNGDFNIAIGHGAGYYIGNYPGSLGVNSYKLYIASVPVTSEDLCEIEAGVGPAPLVYGDLKDLRFGIATKTLHDFGTLQVSGDIAPTQDEQFNLGNDQYRWASVNDLIHFSGNKIGIGTNAPSGSEGLVTVNGSIVPSQYGAYTLGNANLAWDGFFNDITVSGAATITDLEYITKEQWIYEALTLHLGASGGVWEGSGVFTGEPYGPIRGYLDDGGADGAGFILHTSGSDYQRDYKFIYKSPDQSLTCLESDDAFSRGRWQSNISIEIQNGRHLQTDRIIADDSLSLVSRSGCYGLFINTDHSDSGNKVYIGPESYIGTYNYSSDINLYGTPSGSNFDVSTISLESGVSVSHRLLSRGRLSTPRGFELSYKDDADSDTDRFTISRYSNSIVKFEPFIVKYDGSIGFSNISYVGTPNLPKTNFHVDAGLDCDARFSTRFPSNKSRIQLTYGVERNAGVELCYKQDVFDISLLKPSGDTGAASGTMSISSTGVVIGYTQWEYASRISTPATPLVISHASANSGTISLKEQASSPSNIAGFGSIFVKPYVQDGQEQSLYFRDDANNEFNLIQNPNDSNSNLVYIDSAGNTFAGISSPATRPPVARTFNNTAYGYLASSGNNGGDSNSAFGSLALYKNTAGSNNVAIGYAAGAVSGVGAINNNVFIGFGAGANIKNNINHSIIIGYRAGYDSAALSIPDSTLLIGTGNRPLVSGSFSAKTFAIDGGSLSVLSTNRRQEIKLYNEENADYFYEDGEIETSVINILDNDSVEYSQLGGLSLAFTKSDGNSGILMNFRHNANPMTYTPSYHENTTDRPYAELRGDLRLLGDIKFSDGTYLNSSSFIGAAGGYGTQFNSRNGGTFIDLDFTDLTSAFSVDSDIDTENSFIAISVPSGVSDTQTITRLSIQGLGDLIEDGYATISENCNAVFTDDNGNVNVDKNNRSVFIGCEAGVSATGWRNSIIIGTEAGKNSTTPNADIHGGGAVNTASIFMGFRAGYNADNVENAVFIGTNAGLNAVSATDSLFIGENAGLDSNFSSSIGIGPNALRGSLVINESGSGNIEIISPIHQGERLFTVNSASDAVLSSRLNIGNIFAGDMWQKRASIGQATLSPDAVLEVNHSSWETPDGHTDVDYIQTWNSNVSNNKVTHAAVSTHRCSGFMEVDPYGGDTLRPLFIEGFVKSQISAAPSQFTASSGLIDVYRNTSPGGTLQNTGQDIYIVNRDRYSIIPANVYVVAVRVGCEYRPVFVGCNS